MKTIGPLGRMLLRPVTRYLQRRGYQVISATALEQAQLQTTGTAAVLATLRSTCGRSGSLWDGTNTPAKNHLRRRIATMLDWATAQLPAVHLSTKEW